MTWQAVKKSGRETLPITKVLSVTLSEAKGLAPNATQICRRTTGGPPRFRFAQNDNAFYGQIARTYFASICSWKFTVPPSFWYWAYDSLNFAVAAARLALAFGISASLAAYLAMTRVYSSGGSVLPL
jgi:hypothetical protein